MAIERLLDRKAPVLVIGDVMLDRYIEGTTGRISPEAPVPVLKVDREFDRPGGAANVALNLAALGMPVTLVAYVGDDHNAELLRGLLESRGVTCRFLQSSSARTIVKARALSMRQQLLRFDFEDSFAGEDHGALIESVASLSKDHVLAVLSDYSKGTLARAADLIAVCNGARIPVLVDPKGIDFLRYRGATLITPNEKEFAAVAGAAVNEEDLIGRASTMRSDLGIEAILITRGEKGMTLVARGLEPASIPAESREVYDVTGAGDTAIAALAAAIASGHTLVDAMSIANHAAGIVVTRKGTAAVSAAELFERLFRARRKSDDRDPIEEIAEVRQAGQKVVMTNGCFDVLHAGHVDYLRRARTMGDRLVVAINSDASVERLKGAGRPVNSLKHRIAVLSELRSVDWVIPFEGSIDVNGRLNDTPLDLIRTISPDILVKGGDYAPENIVGAEHVLSRGGKVEVLPFLEGLSTTSILRLLRSSDEGVQ